MLMGWDNWQGLWAGELPMQGGDPNHVSFILACGVILILSLVGVWDASVAFGVAGDVSVSDVLRGWCRRWPIFPLFVGIVLGHIFAP